MNRYLVGAFGMEFNCGQPEVLIRRDKQYAYTVTIKCNDVSGFAYRQDHRLFTDTLDRIFSFLDYSTAECAEVRLRHCTVLCPGDRNYSCPMYEVDVGLEDADFYAFTSSLADMDSALNVALNGFEIRALVGSRSGISEGGTFDPRPLWSHDQLPFWQREPEWPRVGLP